MLKRYLGTLIFDALKGSSYERIEAPLLELPKHQDHGDYALTVAFGLAKQLKKSPMVIASELSVFLSEALSSQGIGFEPLNGYINLKLSDNFIFNYLSSDAFLISHFPDTESLILEYVSANPTGPLHIGHGRWAVIGSAIASLLRFVGVPLHTEFYINDAGNQISLFYQSVNAVKSGQPVPENGYHGAYIHSLALSSQDPLLEMLSLQKAVLAQLGASFDCWFSEKSLHDSGAVEEALQRLTERGFTYQQEGALWFSSSQFGDEKDRVLIKADGAYTYFAVDVAYHYSKVSRGFQSLVNIWGADHHGYVMRVKAAVQALMGPEFECESRFTIIIGQLVNLLRNGEPVRMSKRTGDMITIEDVISEIGVDATRFYLLENRSDTHVEFDLEVAKQQNSDNPVYYCQYAHARLCRVLSRAEIQPDVLKTLSLHPKERQLLCTILQFQDEVWDAAMHYSPHRMVTYLKLLARQVHSFYEECPILNQTGDVYAQRLFIVKTAKVQLERVLSLLGLTHPEYM